MKKIVALLLALLSVTVNSYSQLTEYNLLEKIILDEDPDSAYRLNYVFRKEFSKIVNDDNIGVIGNYVGLNTKDNKLSFGYNIIRDDKIIELNFAGGAKEGIAEVFNGNELNSDISLGANYSWILKKKSLAFANTILVKAKRELEELDYKNKLYQKKYDFQLEKLKGELAKKQKTVDSLSRVRVLLETGKYFPTLSNEEKENLNRKKVILNARISLLEVQIDKIEKERNALEQTVPPGISLKDFKKLPELLLIVDREKLARDSIKQYKKELKKIEATLEKKKFTDAELKKVNTESEIANVDLSEAKRKFEFYKDNSAFNINDDDYKNKRRKILAQAKNIVVKDIKLNWLTVGGNIAVESYDLFNSEGVFNEQFSKETDLIPTLSVAMSHYSNELLTDNIRKIKFLTYGAKLKYGNNLSALKQETIETVDSISSNRLIIASQSAYVGDLETEIVTAEFNIDYYNFSTLSDRVGLHLKGLLEAGPFAPIVTLRAGIIISALDKEDLKSIINFEIFYGIRNVFKLDGEEELLNRGFLGLQTTLPLNLK